MKRFNTDKTQIPIFLRMAMNGVVLAMAAGAAAPAATQATRPPPPQNAPHESETLQGLQDKMAAAFEEGDSIRATADAEQRALTDDEQKHLDDLNDQFEALDAEVKRREKLAAQRDRLKQPQSRLTNPVNESGNPPAPEAGHRPRITGGDYAGAAKGSWGWRSFGEYAKGVQAASTGKGVDPRLTAAATTYGSEQSNADGAFAIPPDFRETIVKKVQGEDSLLGRTDQQFTSSNKLTVPMDNTTPWQSSGGIQTYWDSEAAQYTQSKPALEQIEVKLNKLTCLVPVTDELLEDVPSLSRYLPGKVADKFVSKFNDAIVNGDGVAKPQGLLNSNSKVQVAKEAGQATGTIQFANVTKMWARLYAPLRFNAIWVINQDIEPQLQSMVVPGTQAAFPAYLPPGGLSGSQYGTLFGRPLIAVEAAQSLSTEGDIILTNLSAYLTAQKTGGMRSDVSMHLFFDQSMQAFRFIYRLGGQSWWKNAITRQNGTNTLSNIVTLQTR